MSYFRTHDQSPLTPADQAYVDLLDDEILHALAGAEKVPEYGSTNGFMIPVRAIVRTTKPHHSCFELMRDLESQVFGVRTTFVPFTSESLKHRYNS